MKVARFLMAAAAAAVVAAGIAGCGADSAQGLASAAAAADSVVSATADASANVEVDAAGTGLDVTYRLGDMPVDEKAFGRELFDVFAARVLKEYPAATVTQVSHAVEKSKGVVNVELEWPGNRHATFELQPRELVSLQRARNSSLNLPAAKAQLTAVAQSWVPNPEAHKGASGLTVSIVKGFLQYTVEWLSASDFAGSGQGLLTGRYFNALKGMYAALGDDAETVTAVLESMGIDGVRMTYTAAGSDATLQQAFPWREISKPIAE